MTKTTHTPGPWHRNIKPARKYAVIFSGRNTHVAQIVPGGLDDEQVEANCDLIAAAPDLLAALKTAVEIAPADMLETFWGIVVRAAIAKAEGRS